MKLLIDKEAVRTEDIGYLDKYQEGWCPDNFVASWSQSAGHTEYKLYSYLSKLIPDNSIILDIGTYYGGSALALSANPTQTVLSYDIEQFSTHDNLKKDNIQLFIKNFMEEDYNWNNIHLIMIDVSPHDGLQEPPMIDYIINQGFEGLIILDDISDMFPGMLTMWDSLPYEKYQVTDIGHFSGTGILNIGNKFEIEIKG